MVNRCIGGSDLGLIRRLHRFAQLSCGDGALVGGTHLDEENASDDEGDAGGHDPGEGLLE